MHHTYYLGQGPLKIRYKGLHPSNCCTAEQHQPKISARQLHIATRNIA